MHSHKQAFSYSSPLLVMVALTMIGLNAGGTLNDTSLVGSLIHETKLAAPADLTAAASRTAGSSGGARGKGGYHKSKSAKDGAGYDNFDNYNTKDGDSYGFEETVAFGTKGADGMKKGYRKSSRYSDNDDEDDFLNSDKPKYSEWHYEQRAGKPAKTYHYESEDTKLSPMYEPKPSSYSSIQHGYGPSSSTFDSGHDSIAPRKKKEQMSAATDYENVDYGDPEDAVAPTAAQEYEEHDVDPEYAALYGDYGADVYY